MTDYEALRALGYSPMKAAKIARDAEQGYAYAIKWVEIARYIRALKVVSYMANNKPPAESTP